jgi:hypothetical protein
MLRLRVWFSRNTKVTSSVENVGKHRGDRKGSLPVRLEFEKCTGQIYYEIYNAPTGTGARGCVAG